MPPARSTQGRDTGLAPRDGQHRSAAIAGMGYRLAAAGPRTRQRLIERETVAPLAPEPQFAEGLPALASWDDALWDQRISGEPQPALAYLSVQNARFPIWRGLALITAAGCGFSLVLYGQTLQFDRKQHPVIAAKPAHLAEAQPQLPAAPATATEQHAQTEAVKTPPSDAQPALVPPAAPVPPPATETSHVPPPVQAQALAQATPPAERPRAHKAPQTSSLAALAGPVPRPIAKRSVTVLSANAPGPKPHAAVHEHLPRWLTEDRPEHERELIMSPPPHNLQPPPGAQLAATAAPKPALPPLPQHRPALIYAEAHTAPPAASWGAPRPIYNAAPYPLSYGYYGAIPPATPYGQPE